MNIITDNSCMKFDRVKVYHWEKPLSKRAKILLKYYIALAIIAVVFLLIFI